MCNLSGIVSENQLLPPTLPDKAHRLHMVLSLCTQVMACIFTLQCFLQLFFFFFFRKDAEFPCYLGCVRNSVYPYQDNLCWANTLPSYFIQAFSKRSGKYSFFLQLLSPELLKIVRFTLLRNNTLMIISLRANLIKTWRRSTYFWKSNRSVVRAFYWLWEIYAQVLDLYMPQNKEFMLYSPYATWLIEQLDFQMNLFSTNTTNSTQSK